MTPLPSLLLLAVCAAAAVWSFLWIVRWYRRPPTGFPWTLSLIFAAAAAGAVFALNALIGR